MWMNVVNLNSVNLYLWVNVVNVNSMNLHMWVDVVNLNLPNLSNLTNLSSNLSKFEFMLPDPASGSQSWLTVPVA
jgi:hypothetical protein